MNRLAVLGLVLPTLFAPVASARTLPEQKPLLTWDGGITDQLVRFQLSLRDVFRGAANRLAEAAQATGFRAPDLTILTTFPLPTSNDSWATSGFGWRDDPMRHRRKFHSGADIRATSGTPVFVAGNGVVIFSGRQGGYGNIVMVDHGGGVITRYAHLRRILATKGSMVTAGSRIGLVGSTGRATGPHLHFEVRLDGNPVDPTAALTVAELQRDAPAQGKIAAFALSPEMQSKEISDLDPPKHRKVKPAKGESRPDRPGRVKRVRPVS